jgi:predicted nucleic acid-binding protein
MIAYLDSNALVKLFVEEPGGLEVSRAVKDADLVGTVTISRAEVVAAFARALRLGVLSKEHAESARHQFRLEWRHYLQLCLSDPLIERAADLAWNYGLRGYDAVQLAAACGWQDTLGVPVSMVTFDVRLWKTAARAGLESYPPDLPRLCESWKALS